MKLRLVLLITLLSFSLASHPSAQKKLVDIEKHWAKKEMLPVYHFGKGRLEPGIFHFDAAWDPDTRTISVKPLFVQPPISYR